MDLTCLACDPMAKFCDIEDEFSGSRIHSFVFAKQKFCDMKLLDWCSYTSAGSFNFVEHA
jgi:hypothetical protein